MAGIRWASCPTPVTIEAAHTGVTDGKAATQSDTYCPRRISSPSTGAAPASTARSSIAGAIASITHRTSFGGEVLTSAGSPAQHPQAGVLLGLSRSTARTEPGQQRKGHVTER